MTAKIQTLNVMALPLRGTQLIEASAGTGKTFTIGLLYMRLLLGIGVRQSGLRPLSVEEILVVTFTEAATLELRSRIRDNIHNLRLVCLRKAASPTENSIQQASLGLFAALIDKIEDFSHAATLLLLAEQQMDKAAIFTIHGFCQRMLSMHAFESGQLFEQQLLEDESSLQRQAAEDFWRRHCYPLEAEVAKAVQNTFASPENLLRTIQPWLQGSLPRFKTPVELETITARHQRNLRDINEMKHAWINARECLAEIIQSSGVDKRSFSKSSLIKWLNIIDSWAAEVTTDYTIPRELVRFSQGELQKKTPTGIVPTHELFTLIEEFLAKPITLYDLLVASALTEIAQSLAAEKQRQVQLSFDDLLVKLDAALQQPIGTLLAASIRQRYPIAMIDEFQDTDPLQYRIFSTIYRDPKETGMLLIGDPKQAIYAFRGADIFTYMQARQTVNNNYSLDTNWRSSKGMVTAVNQLFCQMPNPFIFEQIPFQPVKAAPNHQFMTLIRNQQPSAALSFWLQPGEGVTNGDYQRYMALECAQDIANWLNLGRLGQAVMQKTTQDLNALPQQTPVQAKDIAVLVRSRREAQLVQESLFKLGIASVYLSNRDSVFTTVEAVELHRLLLAILMPTHSLYLKTALTTAIFGFSADQIEKYSEDSRLFDELTNQFTTWQLLWHQAGILPMLRNVMEIQKVAENWLKQADGERRLTDFMHLCELLQTASSTLESPHALLRYLDRKIAQPDTQAKHQQPRLASEKDLVQIVTIHKSKGLEYPIVWLPFVASFRVAEHALYHNREDFAATLDLAQEEESMLLAEQERLAEDLRLLYVAVTRSIYHCSIGIAPLFMQKRKLTGDTELHHGAIGYLVQKGQPTTAEGLLASLLALEDESTNIIQSSSKLATPLLPTPSINTELSCREFTRDFLDSWRVTSYSGLTQHSSKVKSSFQPLFQPTVELTEVTQDIALNAHNFPRGAVPGTFLHHLFENIDFSAPIEAEWLQLQLATQGYSAEWAPILTEWVANVVSQALPGANIALADLTATDYLREMEFHLPINSPLSAGILTDLARQYDPLSKVAEPISFRQVQGMLKGFIDLVFCHQDKYYILDYKSNWLGVDGEAYSQSAIHDAMIEHQYFLQYQLYSLALHRYLRVRLNNYHYQQNFGGVIYLFLRGMAEGEPGQGIFYTCPDAGFIDKLDKLFEHGELQ